MALNNNPTANEVVKAIKDLEKPATTGNIGLVKPDGISITIDNDGTIRSKSSGNVTSITAGTGLSGGTITTSGTIALSSETQASLVKADSAVQPGDLGTLASQNSIDYTSNQITNKPTIPTTTNELTNNSGFITNAVNNLTNYYKKTETYTQTEINSLIANIKTITAEIVTSLPTASSTTYFNTSKKIYLVLANNDSDDFYNEYITILKDSEYFWEKIGDTKIDLTDYVKNTDYANTSKGGVVIVNNDDGVGIHENGVLQVVPATTAEIEAKTQERKPIVPNTLDYAIEKGLGANSLTWTDTEKLNARNTIGAGTSNFSGDYNDLTNKLTSVNGLTGGNIKGTSGDTPLTVQSASQSTYIGFKNSSGSTLGYLGVNNNKIPVFYDSTARELALKSDIPNVSQSTGTSTADVMSQKATTDELNKKVEFLDFENVEDAPNIQAQINNLSSSKLSKSGDIAENLGLSGNLHGTNNKILISQGENSIYYGDLDNTIGFEGRSARPTYASPANGQTLDIALETDLEAKANIDASNLSETNVESWQTKLSLAKKDLSNVTYPTNTYGATSTGSGDRVIETYISSDGKTWYRKWASGWKEVGTTINKGSNNTVIDFVLPNITFSNTNYVVIAIPLTNTSSETYYSITKLTSSTTNRVYLGMPDTRYQTVNIYCCGF